jgi:hypothetical protein
METQTHTTNTSETVPRSGEAAQNGDSAPTAGLKGRVALVRAQFDATQARARKTWQEVPVKLKAAAQQAFGKVRDGLDLPSRKEVIELSQRIEELDRKLAQYASKKSSR